MKTYILLTISLLGCNLLKAQVIMGGGSLKTSYTQLELQNTTGQKVLIQPAANNNTTLPKYNASQADNYDDDPSMQGMLMYDKNAAVSKVYDGSTWKQAFIAQVKATTWTRAKIDAGTAGCISLFCNSGNLSLSIPTNSPTIEFADYLSTLPSPSTTFFKIRQKGLYRVNFNLQYTAANLGFSGVKINVVIMVNNVEKSYMSANTGFISGGTYLAAADTVLFLDVNDTVNFRVSFNPGGLSIASFTFGGTPESNVSLERIL
ncbi:hypothetical protein [Chryseobacterium sp. StRB126]|uniref:hypothetical protein n=1 Tax=Chryseobacterium sp. StRB126 TaxID=878220 RepID=UPI000A4AE308|nr:hypothetical protein [Chryseobacterium sp. StRB126]